MSPPINVVPRFTYCCEAAVNWMAVSDRHPAQSSALTYCAPLTSEAAGYSYVGQNCIDAASGQPMITSTNNAVYSLCMSIRTYALC
eukprot:3937951-Rhodomonas_salina.2